MLDKDFIKTGKKFYKEYEFYQDDNHGIIDLLIENDDEIIVVDYKLKNIEPIYYEEQVRGYCNYVRTITNKKVRGIIYSIIDETEKNIWQLLFSYDTIHSWKRRRRLVVNI